VLCVLVLASGADWESAALVAIGNAPDLVLLKRCVDVSDLMAAATTGQADIAVVALESPGLDAVSVDHLRRHRVRVIAVDSTAPGVSDDASARRIGIAVQVVAAEVGRLADIVASDADTSAVEQSDAAVAESSPVDAELPVAAGRVIACWGAQGAPGRTTVALGIAVELSRRQHSTILVDADPWGGSVAQQLGVLDQVSGVLAVARLTASGQLSERFASVQRRLDQNLTVITGLPRPDRWSEVRSGSIEHLCELGQRLGDVVVDTGFSIEEESPFDVGSRPGRNSMTLAALGCADEICVVGSADPVGLARLVRALTDLREFTGGRPVRVVVNRMRPSLGWSEKEISGTIEGFARVRSIHFLPEDRLCVDQALVAGGTFPEGPLTRAMSGIVDSLYPETVGTADRGRFRRRTTGKARLR
jgi:MinD-like ATPase involved in chromosome partitioning or flagellar assembly